MILADADAFGNELLLLRVGEVDAGEDVVEQERLIARVAEALLLTAAASRACRAGMRYVPAYQVLT